MAKWAARDMDKKKAKMRRHGGWMEFLEVVILLHRRPVLASVPRHTHVHSRTRKIAHARTHYDALKRRRNDVYPVGDGRFDFYGGEARSGEPRTHTTTTGTYYFLPYFFFSTICVVSFFLVFVSYTEGKIRAKTRTFKFEEQTSE